MRLGHEREEEESIIEGNVLQNSCKSCQISLLFHYLYWIENEVKSARLNICQETRAKINRVSRHEASSQLSELFAAVSPTLKKSPAICLLSVVYANDVFQIRTLNHRSLLYIQYRILFCKVVNIFPFILS